MKSRADATALRIQNLEAQWKSLMGELSDEKAFNNVTDSFREVGDKAGDAMQKAADASLATSIKIFIPGAVPTSATCSSLKTIFRVRIRSFSKRTTAQPRTSSKQRMK